MHVLLRTISASLAVFAAGLGYVQVASAQEAAKDPMAEFQRFRSAVKITVVAQVLNYSESCPDNGCEQYFWYAFDETNCIYRFAGYAPHMGADPAVFNANVKELRLNNYDPKGIKFQSMEQEWADGSISKWVTVNYENQVLISSCRITLACPPPPDVDRVQRGWSLIYSKYCKGLKREF